MTMTDNESLAPILGSLAAAFTRNNRSRLATSPQTQPVDRALGAAASLGLSLAILRLVVYAYKTAKRLEGGGQVGEGQEETDSLYAKELNLNEGISIGSAWYSFVRRLLQRVVLLDSHDSAVSATPNSETDGIIITHQGSCHCKSVHFEVSTLQEMKNLDFLLVESMACS
jgi:hypothetical protein